MQVLADLREKLAPFYSDIGRPSIDPKLMIRMLIVGYCYGIRFELRAAADLTKVNDHVYSFRSGIHRAMVVVAAVEASAVGSTSLFIGAV